MLSSKNSNTKRKQHFCMNCLQGFTQELSRDQHQAYCEDNESVRVEMPKQGSTIEFKDGQNQFKVPFIMYADFESILEMMDPLKPGSPNQPYTNEVNQHTPSGWCVYSKFAYGDVDNPLRTYRGKDCIETFCNYIKGEARRLYHMFPELPVGPLIKKQWKKYKRSTKCHICYKLFTLQYGLLARKGVYPYEYVNSWDRFNETQLPPIDAFYSNLNMSLISEDDYQHAQRVWEEFGIHNPGDYHDLYLRTDVVLLANM